MWALPVSIGQIWLCWQVWKPLLVSVWVLVQVDSALTRRGNQPTQPHTAQGDSPVRCALCTGEG